MGESIDGTRKRVGDAIQACDEVDDPTRLGHTVMSVTDTRLLVDSASPQAFGAGVRDAQMMAAIVAIEALRGEEDFCGAYLTAQRAVILE